MTSDTPRPTPADSHLAAIAPILGRIPSGLFIVTAGDETGRETAMLASWVQQASFAPPTITVAVNRQRWLLRWLGVGRPLGVSILAASQRDLLKTFGRGFEPDEPAFEGIEVVRGTTGVPLLANCLGSLEGRIAGELTTGDHVIYAVEIVSALPGSLGEETQPLVHVRKSGLRY